MTPQRRRQLLVFLRQLGLEAGGPMTEEADSPPLEPIDEALTHSSAGLEHDHERLEFLGDAVLRLAAAEFLQARRPRLSVGHCSALRAQLVSDRWLADLAQRCDLDSVLRLGPLASGDSAGRATVLAECCEALVGGIYEAWGGPHGGLNAVRRWLDPHWQRESAVLLADPHLHNWKSALQEWSQGRGLGLPRYHCEERSQRHGDPRRFHCRVELRLKPSVSSPVPGSEIASRNDPATHCLGEGWGGSRRQAEQQAARQALDSLQGTGERKA